MKLKSCIYFNNENVQNIQKFRLCTWPNLFQLKITSVLTICQMSVWLETLHMTPLYALVFACENE